MAKNNTIKSVLTAEIRQKLLSDMQNVVDLSKQVNASFHTIRNQVIGNSPTLTQPHYMEAIKKILALPKELIIYELLTEQTELHHE